MENISIIIEKASRKVNLFKSVIGNDGENLQENFIFSFSDEFVDGQGRLELILPDKTKTYIILNKVNETYQIPVLSVITHTGKIKMQLVITEGIDENEIPIFKSNVFYVICNSSINYVGNEPQCYDDWMEVANTKLNQMDNFDIDVSKEGSVATVTITDRTGTEKTVQILDGEQGPAGQDGRDATINGVNTLNVVAGENINISQSGSTLTISGEAGGVTSVNGQTGDVVLDIPDVSNFITKDVDNLTYYTKSSDLSSVATSGNYNDLTDKPTIPDVSNFITKDVDDLTNYYKKNETYTQTEIDTKLSAVYKYKGTVATYADLPSTGLTIGDVYNVESDGSNYAWTGTAWDKLGGTVDLSNYVQKTDYATTSKAGLVKASTSYASTVDSDGTFRALGMTYSSYLTAATGSFINKLTLENVITGKGLVNSTDLATKLDSSKVKNANSTTAGDVYDVRYINSLIGDIDSALDLINGESVGA